MVYIKLKSKTVDIKKYENIFNHVMLHKNNK